MRLWGKIRGTEKDYYVCEGVVGGGEGGEEEGGGGGAVEGLEARGSGINKYVYWVTNSATSSWTMLPDLTP